ncbi:MAG TPA: phosphate ABC transporter substrate-binding protein PstS [Gemmataceae bacterium]|jgi:phosphate transport system substrate-binding protein
MTRLTLFGPLAACLAIAGCGRSDGPRIDGGGATFIEPLMLKWQRVYERETGVQVDYTGTGSGNGVQQMTRGAILFGCTDAPMNAEQRAAAQAIHGDVVHIPLAMGGVVPIYRLDGVPEDRPLRFSGRLLADIFLGDVTRWDDPALAELNPGVNLPDLPIRVVSRSDPSGTTAIFAEYLAKMRPQKWADKNMGEGASASFAVGVRQKGNPGVAGEVGRLDGAIGYVELTFAAHMRDRVAFGAVRNRAGRFVVASPESVTAAAASSTEIPADRCFSIVDAPGPDAYPISGTDWAVFFRRLPADRGRPLVEFLRWATARDGGQRYAAPLGYAPLPGRVIARIAATLDEVEFE